MFWNLSGGTIQDFSPSLQTEGMREIQLVSIFSRLREATGADHEPKSLEKSRNQ
ncbi:hypothetical protein [Leptolyngbya sp. GGD]|uniref:hypothetical protein n=1 Tax=Leptolyngbya sp. GGD TaxID=2997907 RepID=UPI00227D63A3|nr:hypothetical protein [Leptolyngbya sp. GGD]MCY6492132.1 hypothetical protein [Leptolyngbya sp. GGD]